MILRFSFGTIKKNVHITFCKTVQITFVTLSIIMVYVPVCPKKSGYGTGNFFAKLEDTNQQIKK